MKVPEKVNSGPCSYCGLDHKDESCPWDDICDMEAEMEVKRGSEDYP